MNKKYGGWASLAGAPDSYANYDTPLNKNNMGLGLLSIMDVASRDPRNDGLMSLLGNILPEGWIPDFNGGTTPGGTSPPPPPPPPPGPTPTPRWAFPDYTQDWAFTPPSPFYTAPPPVFDKSKYPATTVKK